MRLQPVLLLLLPCASRALPGGESETALAAVEKRAEELSALNRTIWTAAEVGLVETKSSAALAQFLSRNGFAVRAGVAGMPTAFVAEAGSGKPVIGILAEFDALPGMSQKALPRREPLESGAPGHACGHSLFGVASAAAAVAAREALGGGPGTIRLYGTPAEETGIGKLYMAREGLFEDCDAVLTWHARDRSASDFFSTKAVVSAKFRFRGRAAHASASPAEGRSALDAVELMNVGANYMREHVPEDARIHYVITDGGGQPNVVPPAAEVWYYVRADSFAEVERLFARLLDVARGAALMTGTEASHEVESECHEVLVNRPLAERIHANLTRVGPPAFSEEERTFARQSQSDLGGSFEKSLADSIEPLPADPGKMKSSTDVGEVSWRVPVGALQVACYTFGAPGHSWQVVACGGMTIGEKGMLVAAKTLALTAVDLVRDPALREAARQDFVRRRGSSPLRSLVPEGRKAPKAIR
ncbi:MAG: amidohydrolase [Planctomycetes bacterium]|nr:amidohydrolase [Planctomycetota bacterium]